MPAAVVGDYLREQQRGDRRATDIEAFAELDLLRESGALEKMSFAAVARLLGWDRDRLRTRLARWAAAAVEVGDPSLSFTFGETPRRGRDSFHSASTDAPQVFHSGATGANEVEPGQSASVPQVFHSASTDLPQTLHSTSADNAATITQVQPRESTSPRAGARASFLEKKTETERENISVGQQSQTCPVSVVIDAEIEPCTEAILAVPMSATPQAILVETLNAEEQVLQVLNEVRREVSPSVRKLSMTTKMEQQIRAALKLLRKDRGLSLVAALPLLRDGFAWVLTSPNIRAEGARNTGTPWVTLLRPSHLLEYLDLASRPEPVTVPRNRTRQSPVPIGQTTEDYVDALFSQVDRSPTVEREPRTDAAGHRRMGWGLP
jgi:hypothetical protein